MFHSYVHYPLYFAIHKCDERYPDKIKHDDRITKSETTINMEHILDIRNGNK